MSCAIDNIQYNIEKAYENAPKEPFVAATKSFLFSGVLMTVLSGGNLPFAALYGTYAAVASLIYTAVTPLFNELSKGEAMSRELHYVRAAVSVIVSSLLVFQNVHYAYISLVFNALATLFSDKAISMQKNPVFIGGVFIRDKI